MEHDFEYCPKCEKSQGDLFMDYDGQQELKKTIDWKASGIKRKDVRRFAIVANNLNDDDDNTFRIRVTTWDAEYLMDFVVPACEACDEYEWQHAEIA